MRQKLLGSVAAIAITVAISGPINAADLPVKAPPAPTVAPACEWCGFYFGGNFGWGRSHHNWSGTDPTGVGNRLDGFAFGLHAGYNWQYASWVFGIEGDGTFPLWEKTWTEQTGSFDTQTRRRIDGLASARVRLGWAFDHTLIYATGGVGWIEANTSQSSTAGGSSLGFRPKGNISFRTFGGVVGGGLEWKYNRNVSFRAEGLYYIFNKTESVPSNISGGTTGVLTDSLKNFTLIRGGISFYPSL
jgi:outer membrane immunogenic protein